METELYITASEGEMITENIEDTMIDDKEEEEVVENDEENDEEEDDKSGIIYLSRIPPFMHAHKLRHLLSSFGKINRIYLTPEDTGNRDRRIKAGGQRQVNFIDGWIEFMDKTIAKQVAKNLNGKTIGSVTGGGAGKGGGGGGRGNKDSRRFYKDDIWVMRYLSKFKWSNLQEFLIGKKLQQKQRFQQRKERFEKEIDYFHKNVNKHRKKTSDGGIHVNTQWIYRQKTIKDKSDISNTLINKFLI